MRLSHDALKAAPRKDYIAYRKNTSHYNLLRFFPKPATVQGFNGIRVLRSIPFSSEKQVRKPFGNIIHIALTIRTAAKRWFFACVFYRAAIKKCSFFCSVDLFSGADLAGADLEIHGAVIAVFYIG